MPEDSKMRLGFEEIPAPVTVLSKAQCLCLLAALGDGRLVKRRGSWHAVEVGRAISGNTVADLVREGYLVFEVNSKYAGIVRLTPRGDWYARTLGSAPNARKMLEATPIGKVNGNHPSDVPNG